MVVCNKSESSGKARNARDLGLLERAFGELVEPYRFRADFVLGQEIVVAGWILRFRGRHKLSPSYT